MINKFMNYKLIYKKIIEKRRTYIPEGYTENHHIIPRSLGGDNSEINLVNLTAKEHFLCHYLLAKMYPKESFEWYKMNHAFMIMKAGSYIQHRYFNSRLYESLKINFSKVMSKNQSGKGNSQYGSMWISNIELKENMKISKSDPIPEGWIHGRNKWNTKIVLHDSHVKLKNILRGSILDGREPEFLELYENHNSINKALKIMGYVGAGKYYYWAKKTLLNKPLAPTSDF